jgi:peptidyl-tRNA hydrolase, PTH1 family
MLLVVGLGNPGREYAVHRHNVGFMGVDALHERLRADPWREKFSGLFARATVGDEQVLLLEPMTYMNKSGHSVQAAMAFFKVQPSELVVIHDELDLPFQEVRLKFGGGHAGHNGLRSIMAHAGTGDFGRVRIGIGRPPPGFQGEGADFVLSPFDAVDRALLSDSLRLAVESVLEVAARGFDAAMKARNTRVKPKKEKPTKPTGEGGAPAEPEPQGDKS